MSTDIDIVNITDDTPSSSSSSSPSSSSADLPSSNPPTSTISPVERIQQLNKIDKEIASLLTHASSSLTSLNSPTPSKSDFKKHIHDYHATLNSVITALRRQVYALEQADIPVPTILAASGSNTATGSTGGGLDIGALNGRSDVVGRRMEEELWRKARGMVEGVREGEEKVDLRMDVDGV